MPRIRAAPVNGHASCWHVGQVLPQSSAKFVKIGQVGCGRMGGMRQTESRGVAHERRERRCGARLGANVTRRGAQSKLCLGEHRWCAAGDAQGSSVEHVSPHRAPYRRPCLVTATRAPEDGALRPDLVRFGCQGPQELAHREDEVQDGILGPRRHAGARPRPLACSVCALRGRLCSVAPGRR